MSEELIEYVEEGTDANTDLCNGVVPELNSINDVEALKATLCNILSGMLNEDDLILVQSGLILSLIHILSINTSKIFEDAAIETIDRLFTEWRK